MQINFLSTRRGARPSPSFSAVDGMQSVILVLCYKTMFYYAHPHYGLGRQRTNQLSSGILRNYQLQKVGKKRVQLAEKLKSEVHLIVWRQSLHWGSWIDRQRFKIRLVTSDDLVYD